MGLGDLFLVSFMPVLKLLLVSFVGSFLALDRVNILGEDARNYLNNIVFYVFSPALIGVYLARTITFDRMISLWFMPVNVLIIFIIGSAFGWMINKVTGVPSKLRGLIVGCCSAGNLGNLLIIIVPAVCKEKGSPFGAPDTCYTYGMAYASLSMAIYSSKKTIGVNVNVSIEGTECFGETSKPFVGSCKEPLIPFQDVSVGNVFQNEIDIPPGSSNKISKLQIFGKFKQILKIVEEKANFKRLFAPSTIAAELLEYSASLTKMWVPLGNVMWALPEPSMICTGPAIVETLHGPKTNSEKNFWFFNMIIGFVVGIVPQLRSLVIGDAAPLRVIEDSASLLSDGAVPMLTMILGGNLVKGLKGSGIKISVIVLIIVARYILLPMSGILIIKTAIHFGLINSDPLYQFVLLLQYTLPPAMNIGVISQLFGQGESECSLIMLWTYSLAPVSLTLWSTTFMWLVS